MKRLLVILGLLGAVFSFFTPTHAQNGIPGGCYDVDKVSAMFRVIYGEEPSDVGLVKGPGGEVYYECENVLDPENPFHITIGHLGAAILKLGAYSDMVLDFGSGCTNLAQPGWRESYCTEANNDSEGQTRLWLAGYDGTYGFYSSKYILKPSEEGAAGYYGAEGGLQIEFIQNYQQYSHRLGDAFFNTPSWWIRNAVQRKFVEALNNDEKANPPGYSPTPQPDDTGGSGPTVIDWGSDGKTRCDGSGNLNIFEKALFFAFEPCEPWADRFTETTTKSQNKMPFGFKDWVPSWSGGAGRTMGSEYGACSLSAEPDPGNIPGLLSCGMVITLPVLDFGFVTTEEVSLSLYDNPGFVFWNRHIREWLWWFFLVSFYVNIFRRATQ